MRLLVDEALQDAVALAFSEAGHDTTHVRLLGLAGHTDDEVMALALAEERVLITTDTDFGTILALTGAAGPNVVLLRGVGDSVSGRVAAVLEVLPRVEGELAEVAVIVVERRTGIGSAHSRSMKRDTDPARGRRDNAVTTGEAANATMGWAAVASHRCVSAGQRHETASATTRPNGLREEYYLYVEDTTTPA